MKILFLHIPKKNYINGRLYYYSVCILPYSLFELSSLLARNNHSVAIINLGIEELLNKKFNLIEYIKSNNFTVICISLHWHFQVFETLKTVKKIKKKLPEVKIIIGGFTASYFYKEIMENFPEVNFLIRGDGEKPILKLIEKLEKAKNEFLNVPNLSFRKNGMIVHNTQSFISTEKEINNLCFTDLQLLKNHNYYDGRWYYPVENNLNLKTSNFPIFYLFTGKGCSVNCIYCGGGNYAQKKIFGRQSFIFRDSEKIIKDIDNLIKFNCKILYFCFDPPRKKKFNYYHNLFKKIERKKLGLSSIFEFYNNLPDSDFLQQFAKTFQQNNSQLAFSPNTADERIRGFYNGYSYKNQDLEKVLQKAIDLNINITLYFTLFPADTFKTIDKTVRWMKRLRQSYNSQIIFMPIEVEPAALWYEKPQKFNIKLIRKSFHDFYYRHSCDEKNLSFEEKLGYKISNGYEKYLILKNCCKELAGEFYSDFLNSLYDER